MKLPEVQNVSSQGSAAGSLPLKRIGSADLALHLQGGQKWTEQQQVGTSTTAAAEMLDDPTESFSSPLAAVQRRLALTAPPKKMLGREAEQQRITAFVEEALAPGGFPSGYLIV